MIEINKLNSKIKTERTAIETVKAELGALYWAKFEAGTQLDDDAAALCAKMKGSFEAIAGFEAEIKRIKEENEKKPEPASAAAAPAASAPVAEGTFCPSCGAKIASGAKFCPECGSPAAPVKRICPACGAELAEGAKFCPECGAKA
ncbi:MAG: zinc ribbon domain-containing protein [Christensenellaceae bacterium]|nr:zinc ribbon domain-containing protein [Christensenellaceae bacterium]